MINPFDVTKAVDLSDRQIERTYVTFGGRERSIVDPASAMPQFLTGIKGGGRTHLMRHYSYPLQKARHESSPLAQVQADGYLGVYFRCSGLDGSRFRGKGQPDEAWAGAFAFYLDLWITELLIATVMDVGSHEKWTHDDEGCILDAVARILRSAVRSGSISPLAQSLEILSDLRSDIDWAVNNAAHTGELELDIRSNPGRLLFGVCQAVAALPGLADVRITFLADEYENLDVGQQIYFNTLIREKEAPATFLIGARSWGVRTHLTLSAGEENKKGSEYEISTIEEVYARDETEYENFCRHLVSIRLQDAGLEERAARAWVAKLSHGADDRFLTNQLEGVLAKFTPENRPHLVRLRKSVTAARTAAVAGAVTGALSFPENPLLEKLAILRFYQAWAKGQLPTVDGAVAARESVAPLLEGTESRELLNFFNQRKSDAVAQIYRDANRKSVYAGFAEFVDMSGFLPRSLLMILKYVVNWANFNGEDPLHGTTLLSGRALSEGVLDAAHWYFADAKPLGLIGEQCEIAVRRLGVYLQAIRYSDKPSEIDVATFSSNFAQASDPSREVLEQCISHGLLLEVRGGRAARNHGSTHRKFQLHPMLTPIWGLRPGRRGDVTMTSETFEAIFHPESSELAFGRVRENAEKAMNAPFGEAVDTRDPMF